MTEFDPFADAPEDEAQSEPTQEPVEAPAPAKKAPAKKSIGAVSVDVKPNLLPLDEGKVVLTFKGGTGFDAPWIVIHAKDLQDAFDQVSGDNVELLKKLMEHSNSAGKYFTGLGGGKPSQGAPARQAAPAPAQQPPAGSPPCPGDGWVYKSGVGRCNGKPWQGWMPPRGSDEKPVFF